MEGVMIRSPEQVAVAVRRPDRTIVVRAEPYVSLARRVRGLHLPLVRGVVSFGEMLVIGLKTLSYSAQMAAESHLDEVGETVAGRAGRTDRRDAFVGWLTMSFAFAAAVGVFFFLPLTVSSLLGFERRALAYNVLAGFIRIALLLLYLWSIGRVEEIARVFAYHGAEHQAIFAYEAGEEITVASARRHTRFHPRCGTSFILIVVLLAVLTYAVVDTAFMKIVGRPQSLLERFAVHICFLPVVAGAAFEALKLSGKHRASRAVQLLVAPGLWLQQLTTRPPTDEQLEVAVAAAWASLGLPVPDAQKSLAPSGR